MKMLICLHDNPLEGQEFDQMVPILEKNGYQAIIHKRSLKGCIKLEPLLQSINALAKVSGGGPFGLVAYSWGAYLALAYLRRFPENVTEVLLINPLLTDQKPIKFMTRWLLSLPILRSILLKIKRRKLAKEYIESVFRPEKPSRETFKSLYAYLSQSSIWKGELAYKKLMMEAPLSSMPSTLTVPVRVLFGERDEVAPKLQQMPILETLNHLDMKTVPNIGHAIPWTHPALIIEELMKFHS